jgi:release factor glutamine methyltransferase
MSGAAEQRLDAVLREARRKLDPVDAEWLLAHALGRPRSWLYAHADDTVDAGIRARFAELVERRAAGEPVAYLTRSRGFWNFDLRVTPDTLIPRPETELLVELALARLPETAGSRIADMGTGSGAIALALARERPRARVVATDISDAALAIARENAAALAIDNVRFGSGSWYSALDDAPFDLIASNPPYVADGDPHLAAGDLRFEPGSALASGHDGLDAIRAIVRDAPAHLVPGGWLLLEHGIAQGAAVRALLCEAGFIDVETARDLEERERVTLGRRMA